MNQSAAAFADLKSRLRSVHHAQMLLVNCQTLILVRSISLLLSRVFVARKPASKFYTFVKYFLFNKLWSPVLDRLLSVEFCHLFIMFWFLNIYHQPIYRHRSPYPLFLFQNTLPNKLMPKCFLSTRKCALAPEIVTTGW